MTTRVHICKFNVSVSVNGNIENFLNIPAIADGNAASIALTIARLRWPSDEITIESIVQTSGIEDENEPN